VTKEFPSATASNAGISHLMTLSPDWLSNSLMETKGKQLRVCHFEHSFGDGDGMASTSIKRLMKKCPRRAPQGDIATLV
jgi:hypothetical protein